MNSTSRALAVLMVGYLILALESPMLQQLQLSFFAPDLGLIVVVWVALNMNFTSGVMTCFVLGYLKDGFVMGAPIGMHMEIFVVVFVVLRLLAGKLQMRGLLTLLVTTALATVLACMLFALLSLLFDGTFTDYGLVVRLAIPVALVTAPFAPVVFFVLDRVDATFVRRGKDSLFH
ncbi:MAG: rod shape-determining protein MreD [Myxococcota bacterium]|jgi:rod shape-determining protein MreD